MFVNLSEDQSSIPPSGSDAAGVRQVLASSFNTFPYPLFRLPGLDARGVGHDEESFSFMRSACFCRREESFRNFVTHLS